GATSAASDSPSAVTAIFDARYVPRNGTGTRSDDDVMLQITPPPLARMIGTARLVTATSPNTLVSNSFRQLSSGMNSSGRLSLSTPALFTSTRKLPGSEIVAGAGTSTGSTPPRGGPPPPPGGPTVARLSTPPAARARAAP